MSESFVGVRDRGGWVGGSDELGAFKLEIASCKIVVEIKVEIDVLGYEASERRGVYFGGCG